MNLKTRAMLHTVGLFVGTIAVSLGVTYIGSLLTHEQVMWILASAVGGLFIYLVYGIMLSRLEYQDALKDINQSVSE
jgi:hypothetical protein